ncbi:hypothetical protein [Streptomyces sp. NPDC059076]|uniref:hypothetical protein n=1 Tax=unclassified Streptomyces TaxID=2593676 RepID=UPI00368F2137
MNRAVLEGGRTARAAVGRTLTPDPDQEVVMAILMHATMPDVTTEQYDTLNKELQALPGDTFAGCLTHVCVATSTGIEVYDLWESKEAMEKFFTVMMPVTERLGWSAPEQEPTQYEVYNHWVAGK